MTEPARYAATRESLRTHPVPDWYHDAKLGIFVHWSVPSVPGFAPRDHDIQELIRARYDDFMPLSPYSEWYWNSLQYPWSPVARHHREVHGERPYEDFARDFEKGVAAWDPDAWAEDFAAAGARYVVMVTKHHDGYCLWPSRVPHPARRGWHSARDCVGGLAAAVRARGMRFGVYYSGGIDWSVRPRPARNLGEFMASVPRGAYPDYAEAQVRELVERLRPDLLWNDIAWPTSQERLFSLFADYYAAVPEGVVNDRWLTPSWLTAALRVPPLRALANALLKRAIRRSDRPLDPPRPPHFDARTPEYAVFPDVRAEKWESVRGIDKSFGYNRSSRPEDFLGREELLRSLADIVSKNGNLLLNVGPRGEDAVIPAPQRERLAWLGELLGRAGEAFYGTRPWRRAEGTAGDGTALRFSARGDTLYVLVLGTPRGARWRIPDVPGAGLRAVELLGRGPLVHKVRDGGVEVEPGAPWPDEPVHALALRGVHAEAT